MLLSEYSTNVTNPHQLQLMVLDLTANYTLANSVNLGPALANASDVWGPNGAAGFVPIGGSGRRNVHRNLQRQRQHDSDLTISFGSSGYAACSVKSKRRCRPESGTDRRQLQRRKRNRRFGRRQRRNSHQCVRDWRSHRRRPEHRRRPGRQQFQRWHDHSVICDRQRDGRRRERRRRPRRRNSSTISSRVQRAGTGGDKASAGGLVGVNFSIVSQSRATGAVTVGANSIAGGLVGENYKSPALRSQTPLRLARCRAPESMSSSAAWSAKTIREQ